VAPWTQSLSLRWLPELSFYERRTELLRQLEAEVLLVAFRFGEQSIGVQLEEHAVLDVQSTGLSMRISSPRASLDGPRTALAAVLTDLSPQRVTLSSVTAQFLFPLDSPSEVAASQTANELVAELSPDAQATDWSILLDGQSAKLGATFQVEYGVIGADEAPDRIGRVIGRVGADPAGQGHPDLIDVDAVPGSAFFFDWRWTPLTPIEDGGPSRVTEVWDAVTAESERLSRKMQARFSIAEGKIDELEARG
jgi:hypothetical protein